MSLIWQARHVLVEGTLVTIAITLMATALAVFMAFVAGLARLSPFRIVRAVATAYVEFFRGTSILCSCSGPTSSCRCSASITPLHAVVGLGLNGAYGAEVVRGAVRSVAREQHEACIALNLTRRGTACGSHPAAGPRVMLPVFGNKRSSSSRARLWCR